jgi:hypothetical protein
VLTVGPVGAAFTVTVTLEEANVEPLVFWAASVSVPVPGLALPLNDTLIVVAAPEARFTEVGEGEQLPESRLPLQTVATRFTVSVPVLMFVSVNVVELEALVLTLAVPLPSWLRLTDGMLRDGISLPRTGVAFTGPGTSSASTPSRYDMASTAVRRGARRPGKDDHHRSTRSSSATYADSIATTPTTTAIHVRTSRTRANAPAYRSTSFSLSPSARAGVVSTRFRHALVLFIRVIARLRSLKGHVAAVVAVA